MAQDGTGELDAAGTAGSADPAPVTGPVAAEELPVDPRTIARASLAAGRNSSLWWVTAGVGVAIAVSVLVSTAAGALTLAGLLAVGAVVRAATPPPGPAALVARSRPLDVLMLFSLAFALAILSQVIPTR
ncbi:MAG TPA: DUF3017 domain-containing protein [Cellulomonas sp.]|uniref:DUF3017 domain-containing protein n=1 Tax=Cellulomonas sp. TaxID=40001 RepID=UPI002E2F72AD|nr:DUF3017 domain-containing protein [Cellulomonas sp.]HEX5333813.1 DUF3017 domain-containing protein [Cellulomonas sp.]